MDSTEEIKNKLDLVDYIGQTIQLKRSGRNFKGLCPFHQEKTPSFFVSPERQMYKCFGCGESGDLFAFYMKQEGVDFAEALRDLAQRAGVVLKDFSQPSDLALKQRLMEINQAAAKFYHYLLVSHRLGVKALCYVKDRQVTTSQIELFQLGYAPQSWQSLSNYLIKKKHYQAQDVEKTGLILQGQSGWYDRFRGRIMFPLFDIRGNLVGFSGRVLPWTDDGKSGKYINSPETILYHKAQLLFPLNLVKDRVRKKNQVVVVEGEFDALSSFRAGAKQVVAVKGSALTEDQVRLIKRYTDTIIFALDTDEAGIQAAIRAIGVARNQEMNIKVAVLPEGKDPDELVKLDPKKWLESVRGAVNMYDFLIQITIKRHNPKTVDGKQAITKFLIPLINQIENRVIQAHYLKELSKILAVDEVVMIQEQLRQSKLTQLSRLKVDSSIQLSNPSNPSQALLESLLAIMIHFYPELDLGQIPIEDLPELAITKIFKKLESDRPKSLIDFAKSLAPELQAQFDSCFLQEVEKQSLKQAQEKVLALGFQLAKMTLRDRLGELRNQLKSSSPENLDKIKRKMNNILKRLRRYNWYDA